VATSDSFDSLFVKGGEVNRELLGKILLPYIRLDEKGNVFPLSPFFAESSKKQILLLLLARKAISLKTGLEDGLTPTELGKLCNIPDGTIRPTLRALVEERIVDDENSQYKVYPGALQRCAEILAQKKESPINPETKKNQPTQSRMSMRGVIEDILRQGGLDEGKTVREILELVLRRRPGTEYNILYKVILDLVHEQKLVREMKEDTWYYKKVNK
jgi:hypothetical protein